MEAAAHAVLDAAYAGGIRHFDAARSYGRAEAFLGSWLDRRGLGRDDVVVSSKWGYAYTAGWSVDAEEHEVKELSAAQLRRQWPETEALLGDRLRSTRSTPRRSRAACSTTARCAPSSTRCASAGSGSGSASRAPARPATIDRAVETGGFDAVQATWNLHERSAGPALERAHAAGLEVYVKEGVANGRLTARGGNAALAAAARERGVGEDALALAAVLARPWAGVVLSGAATRRAAREQPGRARRGVGRRAGGAARGAGGAGRRVLGDARGAALELSGSASVPVDRARCGRTARGRPGRR